MTKTYPCLSLVLISLFASQSRCSCQEEELADLTCTLECYTGPSGTAGTGICRKGANICDEEGNVVGCGDIVPEDEICDGLDNNCNGSLDEGLDLACRTLPPEISAVGVCVPGVKRCANGRYTKCQGEGMPQEEICDGLDNDCDGIVDNILSEPCGFSPNVGECRRGWTACDNAEAVCYGEIFPQEEVCDGADNDCDGEVDEDIFVDCYSGRRDELQYEPCRPGKARCVNGAFGPCQGEVLPTEEVCDGIDNNCDGYVDNLTREEPCGDFSEWTGCPNGIFVCQDGEPVCLPPSETEFCDNVDNDCDGEIDEDVEEACYTGPEDTRGVGECADGVRVCQEGQWGECMNEMFPEREICDGLDNDCDGIADNNVIFCGDLSVFVDISGSTFDDLHAWLPALRRMASILCPETRVHLIQIPIHIGNPVVANAVSPQDFELALAAIGIGGWIENQYDALFAAIPENNSLGLAYRTLEECETPPFCRKFIVMTDECAQHSSTGSRDICLEQPHQLQYDLAEALTDFGVATYVFTHPWYNVGWTIIIAGNGPNVGGIYSIDSRDENVIFQYLEETLAIDCSLVGN